MNITNRDEQDLEEIDELEQTDDEIDDDLSTENEDKQSTVTIETDDEAIETDDEESEEYENSETTEEEMQEQAREQFRTALYQILGEDVASEDLVVKLEAIFEAAVTERVENTVASIVEGVDQNVKTYLDNVTEALVEKVDDYLDYVVEEWLTENTVSVEQGIKTQIAENFINGLKNLFENHYIDVPSEKYNALDELYAQNRDLEQALNNSINENMDIKKDLMLNECATIFVAETRDLADTQIAKLQSLMETVSFASPAEYQNKLGAIKANYLSSQSNFVRPIAQPINEEMTFSPVNNVENSTVGNYVSAIAKLNKKI